jgi:hypothetical protein
MAIPPSAKTPLSLALGAVACLLLSSCVIFSKNPISSPDAAQIDPLLLGDWHAEDDGAKQYVRITATDAHWMHLECFPHRNPTKVDPDDLPDSYDLFPTVIGKHTFLNVRTVEKDDHGRPTKGYRLYRYKVHGRKLQMWLLSQDYLADAIRAGKIKGVIHEDKKTAGSSHTHPDIDIMLTDTSENIAKFIASSDLDDLFSEKMETLYRVKTTR